MFPLCTSPSSPCTSATPSPIERSHEKQASKDASVSCDAGLSNVSASRLDYFHFQQTSTDVIGVFKGDFMIQVIQVINRKNAHKISISIFVIFKNGPSESLKLFQTRVH